VLEPDVVTVGHDPQTSTHVRNPVHHDQAIETDTDPAKNPTRALVSASGPPRRSAKAEQHSGNRLPRFR
jgi:hypothetical protein